ncbi:AcvB/VirJ family lysyl-phosphatidylglycerol hydrolase [Dyadobacter endophyticus]|uniref:AcvB/VirJ family lysyl-phosphatidylglycerol hydrolase n=1 Tax=Dyadobacter endophyticus TaxID=1749036 RepID=UPI003CEF4018
MNKLLTTILLLCTLSITVKAVGTEFFSYGPFGKITLYHPTKQPSSVALFVSGDGGWDSGVINMAKTLAEKGALVLGIDARTYKKSLAAQKQGCLYPASDFENLSLMIQKKYKFPTYFKPVLVGYSYGAVLVYGILAQAPANTFKGALALGFCPDIDVPRPLCKGTALSIRTIKEGKSYYLEKTSGLTAPFIVLNGVKDLNCLYQPVKEFLSSVARAELVPLQKVGHGFGVDANWLPQFKTAYQKICDAPSFAQLKAEENQALRNQNFVPFPGQLPLCMVPASRPDTQLPLVFFVSGDGGWTSFDQSVSEAIASLGMPVIGMDAQKYFWNKKSPETASSEIAQAINYYRNHLQKTRVVLVGFSFGASIVPFVANRLALGKDLEGMVLFSPSSSTDFEVHLADMLSIGTGQNDENVLSEILKAKAISTICVFGSEEDVAFKNKLTDAGIKTALIPGGHHYDENYRGLAETVLKVAE